MTIASVETVSESSTTEVPDELSHFDEALRKTHVVDCMSNPHVWDGSLEMTSEDVVAYAREHGIEIVALCGYKWVPSRDPQKYDACSHCMEIARELINKYG